MDLVLTRKRGVGAYLGDGNVWYFDPSRSSLELTWTKVELGI